MSFEQWQKENKPADNFAAWQKENKPASGFDAWKQQQAESSVAIAEPLASLPGPKFPGGTPGNIRAQVTETEDQGPYFKQLLGSMAKGGMSLGKAMLEMPVHIVKGLLQLEPNLLSEERKKFLLEKRGITEEQAVEQANKTVYAKMIKDHRQGVRSILKSHPEWEYDPPENFLDLLTSPRKVSLAIAESTPLMVAAGITTVAGRPDVAFAMMYASEGQQAHDSAIEYGATPDQAEQVYHMYGSVAGILENLQLKGIMNISKKSFQKVLTRTAQKTIGKSLTKDIVRVAAQEALEEIAQGTWEEATAKIVYDRPVEGGIKGFVDRRAQEGLIGGTMGLIPGIGGGIAGKIRARRTTGDPQVTHRMPDGSIMQGPEHPGAVPGSTVTEPTQAAVSKKPEAITEQGQVVSQTEQTPAKSTQEIKSTILAKPKTVPEKAAEVRESLPEAKLSRRPVKVDDKTFHPVSIPTEQIGVDPERFQFKLGAKLAGGVTEALEGVQRFDPVKGGQILVWQDNAGKNWVVDGHHRVALAKKTGAESLDTWVVKESEGVTASDARAIGALRNLADGKGTAVDAAKLFRDTNMSLSDLKREGVPTNNMIIKQGFDMADLSDEVFRLVVDERIAPNMAAVIGKRVKGDAQQKQIADKILEGEVDTVRQAEFLAMTIDSAPVLTKTEQTLFGVETTEKSLYAERAKVLDNVEKKLKTNKKVFGVLATRTGIIEAKGNILAKVENLAAKEQAEEVLFMLEKLANSKGPIAEALNDATKRYAENPTSKTLSEVTEELLKAWTEGPGRLRIPGGEAVSKLPLERVAKKVEKTIQTSVGEIQIPTEELDVKWDRALEVIFDYGNQTSAGKPNQPGLSRSLSMGDTIEYEGKTWLVMPSGWQDVSQLTPGQIKKLVGKDKFRPGKLNVAPLNKMFEVTMKTLEPAKITERAFGKDPGAIVIKGVHQADVGRIEFNEAEIEHLDSTLDELGQKLSRYSDKILKNLMASRGKPISKAAILTQKEALADLIKEAPELVGMRKMITRIADMNYKYLQSVVGDDIKHVEDYFYGIYKDTKDATVENFLEYWNTTKRFTKQKKLPTVADAIGYGLELRDYNPVNNLRAEYMAISRIDGMIYMRDELMRTGKGRYIDVAEEAPHGWEKLKEPVFKDVRLHPELAIMIKNLLATNKLRRSKFLRGLTRTNNAFRTLKFAFSGFHHLNIIKQSIADEGYLQFLQPSATRGMTFGFKKNDPIFKTPAYKDYIKHGGGHRYSIESQAERAFSQIVGKLDKTLGVNTLPINLNRLNYIKWLFQDYIPKVKYSKYLDAISMAEQDTGKTPTSAEKIEIIKEQQNFYGMMNERLFGRSGTVTSLLRLWFMSPGYGEGNYRTMLKSILQWGGKDGHKANRSRSNILNSLLLSATIGTIGTLILTGKPPRKPETLEDVRDMFKIDTGKVDAKGRRIMIDMLTYDKDYWDIIGQTLIGRPDKAAKAAIKRGGGMVATTAQVAVDIANMAAGRAIYDWKGDRVVEITDPFARQVLKMAIYEIQRIEPISVSVYKQARKREQTKVLSAMTALLGYRPTLTEKDKREQAVLHRIYSLRGQQEELYYHLSTIPQPRKVVASYNRTVDSILNSPMTPKAMKAKWEKKLIIDIDRMIENKAFSIGSKTRTDDQIKRDRRFLKNLKVTANDIEILIKRYKARPKTKTVISPLERDPVIGLAIRKKRAKERFEKE